MAVAKSTLGDMLLRRYVIDFVASIQQLSSPLFGPWHPWENRCRECRSPKENAKFKVAGNGAFFPSLHSPAPVTPERQPEDCICMGLKTIPIPFKDLGFDNE